MTQDRKHTGDSHRHLLDLVRATTTAPDFEGTLATLIERANHLVPSDGVSLMWLDGDQVEVLASRGATAPLRGLILPAAQMGAAQAVLDSNRPVVVPDIAKDARWQRVPGEEHVRAWLGVPFATESQTLGVLEWTARQPTAWTALDVGLALEMARYSAPVVVRAQLLHDMRLRLRELAEPRADGGSQAQDLGTELQPVVREALDFCGARDAFVFLMGDSSRWLRCVAASGERRDQIRNVVLRGDGTLGGWSISMARARDWFGSGATDRETMAAQGIDKTLILPLRVGKEPVGMLGVADPHRGGSFGQDALRLMTHLASQASLVVERSYQERPEIERYDYEMVIQGSPLGIGVLTITGDIRVNNPALASLLFHAERSLVGHNVTEFLVLGDAQRLRQTLEEVAVTGQRRQVDVRLPSSAEEHRHVRISLALAHISDDVGGNLVALVEDVTSLKILEQERVDHLRELREKHQQLQDLDKLKSRFVSNVSHELRTPLAVIKLYATLARKGRPEKQAYYLQTIEQETHRLETMVENILDLTRLDRHSLRVSPELVHAEEIIGQVLEVYEEPAKKQGIELRSHVHGELPPLWADKNHFIQMLTNLMDNAFKYTPRGGQVWVAARETSANSRRTLEIAIGDTGVGIPDDEQDKVFERFYRGSNNTPGSTGTGLGLAIVQELMIQHGGKVTLKSHSSEGSIFALQFPLSEQEHPPEPVGQPEAAE